MSVRPIVDLAAVISLFIGASMGAAMLEQLGEIARYGLPITLLEIPTPMVITSGLLLFLVLVLLLPTIYIQKRTSLRRSQRSLFLLQFNITAIVFALLLIPFLNGSTLLPHAYSSLNFFNDLLALFVAFTPLLVLAFALSPVPMGLSLSGYRNRRAKYFAAMNAEPRSKRQERRIIRVRESRERNQRFSRRLRPSEVMSTPISPTTFYVLYVASFFLISAYAFGFARSYTSSYSVTTNKGSLQLVILAYPDLLISTCYNDQKHTFAPGYVVRRLTNGDAQIVYKAPSPTARYVPRIEDDNLTCGTGSVGAQSTHERSTRGRNRPRHATHL